jgi:hypothetical protein
LKYVIKYENNPIEFFEDEIENCNYVSTKMLKKIGKLYAMAKDDEQPVSESILNWNLHQQIMKKKYGKKKYLQLTTTKILNKIILILLSTLLISFGPPDPTEYKGKDTYYGQHWTERLTALGKKFTPIV